MIADTSAMSMPRRTSARRPLMCRALLCSPRSQATGASPGEHGDLPGRARLGLGETDNETGRRRSDTGNGQCDFVAPIEIGVGTDQAPDLLAEPRQAGGQGGLTVLELAAHQGACGFADRVGHRRAQIDRALAGADELLRLRQRLAGWGYGSRFQALCHDGEQPGVSALGTLDHQRRAISVHRGRDIL